MTPKDVFDFLQAAGTLGFAIIALYALLTERVVPRARLDEQRLEKKEALDLLKKSVESQERQNDAIERLYSLLEQRLDLERRR